MLFKPRTKRSVPRAHTFTRLNQHHERREVPHRETSKIRDTRQETKRDREARATELRDWLEENERDKLGETKGYVIMDFLEKFEGLMAREFGSKELLAKAGEIVAERAREEAEVLRDEGEVEERMVTELFRVLKLMEMDLAMVKASVKEETLSERIEQARARCRQAILVANSFKTYPICKRS